MTWRDQTAVAILLFVARIICPEHANEIKTLATSIAVWGRNAETLDVRFVSEVAPRENGAAT